MRSNVFTKGIYQSIFVVFLVNLCAVQAAYHKFVDDPAQRKLCRAHTYSACVSDKKCGYNFDMRVCNEAGYQPDVQTCEEVAVCGGCEPSKRPDSDGWKLVFELEDDNLIDDVPDDPNEVFAGFKNKNAFFVGAQKLKTIKYNMVQFCAGYRATSDGCPRVKCYNLEESWTTGLTYPKNINDIGFSKSVLKTITCLVGGADSDCGTMLKGGFTHHWRFPIGYADDPAQMDTYGNAKTGDLVFHCGGSGSIHGLKGIGGAGNGFHFSGYGWTSTYRKSDNYNQREQTHNELGMYPGKGYINHCGNKKHMPPAVANDHMEYMNLVQIRMKYALNEGFTLGNCKIPSKSPYEDGWKVVFELEDDNSVDDVPDDPNTVFAGFKRKNAFFVGAQKLKSMTFNTAQFCAGYRATSDGCPRVKCYNLEESWTNDPGYAYTKNINDIGFSKSMMKAITCFAGGGAPDCSGFVKQGFTTSWRFPIGYADDPAQMDTYGNAKTGDLVFTCGEVSSGGMIHGLVGPGGGPAGNGFHFSGHGWTATYQKSSTYNGRDQTHNELAMFPGRLSNKCGNKKHMPPAVATDTMEYMNLVQIRVK